MRILVLNGSPKGATSVTMQYVQYIQKMFPQHELSTVLFVHRKAKKLDELLGRISVTTEAEG